MMNKPNLICRKRKIAALLACGIILILTGFGTKQANAASVALSAAPTTQTVTVGQTATYTINLNRDGYADKVTLSATGLPAGATAAFAPNTTTAPSSVLTVKTLTTTPVGTFNITVKATATGITIAPIVVKLTTKPAPSIAVSVNPATQSIVAGQPTFYDIAINRFNYDGAVTLSAENLPAGVTVQFEPPTTYGNSSRMYLYSNGLPFLAKEFSMIVRVRGIADIVQNWTTFYLVVNCGIAWTDQFGTPNNQTAVADFATAVFYDASGNVYSAGNNLNPANQATDVWVAKHDRFGTRLWVQSLTTLTEDRVVDVFADAAGNVYIAGITRMLPLSPVNYNIFVAKFDAGGNLNPNVITPGTSGEEGLNSMQFGVNSSGNVTLTAATQIRRFGIGEDIDQTRLESVDFDITRFVFDANLNIVGNSGSPIINNAVGNPKDLKVGADGSIYVLKEDLSQIDSEGLQDVWVAVEKFNAPNGQNWQTPFFDVTLNRDLERTIASRLAVDAQGNVFAVGNIEQLRTLFRPQKFFSWHLAFNPNSTLRWQKEIAYGEFEAKVLALDVDAAGNVFYGGYTFDSLRGVNPNRGLPDDSLARSDAFFAKLSGQNGNELLFRQFNVIDKDGFTAMKVGTNRELYFAGYTVFFKGVNFFIEDALVMKYSTKLCLF